MLVIVTARVAVACHPQHSLIGPRSNFIVHTIRVISIQRLPYIHVVEDGSSVQMLVVVAQSCPDWMWMRHRVHKCPKTEINRCTNKVSRNITRKMTTRRDIAALLRDASKYVSHVPTIDTRFIEIPASPFDRVVLLEVTERLKEHLEKRECLKLLDIIWWVVTITSGSVIMLLRPDSKIDVVAARMVAAIGTLDIFFTMGCRLWSMQKIDRLIQKMETAINNIKQIDAA